MQGRALVLGLILAGCSCDAGIHAPDAGRPAPSAPSGADTQERTVREWLRAQAIGETHFGARVLYAWLSDAEADALRSGTSLTALGAGSALDDALRAAPDALTSHLGEARRDAWPSAWASRLGWTEAAGGTHLARVELAANALLVIDDARTTPHTIAFATDRGAPAPNEEALQVPELWAAVLVVTPRARSYVLVNDTLITRVAIGTPEIAHELRTSRDRLDVLAHLFPDTDRPISTDALSAAWRVLPAAQAPLDALYAATLPAADRAPTRRDALAELARLLVDHGDPYERGAPILE